MCMVESGAALCVPGNHDARLVRALQGRKVQRTHGLAETLAQLDDKTTEFKKKVETFLGGLVSHYVLDEGTLGGSTRWHEGGNGPAAPLGPCGRLLCTGM